MNIYSYNVFMKYFLILFIVFYLKASNSQEKSNNIKDWTFEYSGFVKLNTINFPNTGKVIQITNDFTWKDSLGNYGKGVCYGIAESLSEKGDNLKYFCEMNDQDDESFFTKGERLSDEVEVGVGTQSIIDGIGKWKTFVGSKCTYGVKYKDNVVFASQKCKTSL